MITQYGVGDSKYVVISHPKPPSDVTLRMRTGKTLYNEEAQSINRSYVEFANKTANIKYKKLISLQYRVRASKQHTQNSTNHFDRKI